MATVCTAILEGLEARPCYVTVRIVDGDGLPIVRGLSDSLGWDAVSLAHAAVVSSGMDWPAGRLLVEIEPSCERADGLDDPVAALAIALAVLEETGQADRDRFADKLVVGCIGTSGNIGELKGTVAFDRYAKSAGLTLVAADSSYRCGGIMARTLVEAARSNAPRRAIENTRRHEQGMPPIPGLPLTKLATMASALGGLNILISNAYQGLPIVSPGTVARGLREVMPPMTGAELEEVELAYSACGIASAPSERPLRVPDPDITHIGMFGGGRPLRSGEIALANRGVMLLDPVERFSTSVVDMVATACANRSVTLTRARGTWTFPAATRIVAASGGSLGHLGARALALADIVVDIEEDVRATAPAHLDLTFDEMRDRVEAATQFRNWREGRTPAARDESVWEFVSAIADPNAPTDLALVGEAQYRPSVFRVLDVARAIADLEIYERVLPRHAWLAAMACGVREIGTSLDTFVELGFELDEDAYASVAGAHSRPHAIGR